MLKAHHGVCFLLAVSLFTACNETAATGPGTAQLTAADIIGSYKLVQFDGRELPAIRAPSVANDFKSDTVIAGCLLLGPVGSGPPTNASNYVSITLFFAGVSDTAYVQGLTKCPRFLPADHQGFTWDGSRGSWAFCGTHDCDTTAFIATRKDNELTIVTGTPGHETMYVRWSS